MPPIRLLAPDLVAKIAAGEVVERPASVVKELVENALDAGASAIRIEIQRGGLQLIRVTDDGCGIPADEVGLAVCRHATSKLATLDDLSRVRTLGFRGEALASIAAVARLELRSRARGAPSGRLIRLEGGRVVEEAAAGGPEGTTVTVRQLFFNVPARQAFQRSPAGEARQIISLCNHLALTAPHVRLVLEVDGHVALKAPGNGSLREAIAAAYGPSVAAHMLPLPELEEEGVRVWGFCSGPEEHRNTRLYFTFVVNGRLVRSPMLSYALEEAYHALLPGGRHPLAAVHLAIAPEELDVNVHPQKTEIRFRRERLVFALVRDAVREALAALAPAPALELSAAGALDAARPAGAPESVPAAGGGLLLAPPAPARAVGPDQPVLVEAAAPPPRVASAVQRAAAPPAGRLRALGQVGLTYIVAEDATGVYLIDQHSAHERVLYEQLLRQSRDAPPAARSQLLLAPETVDLSAAQSAWLAEHVAVLEALGYRLEPFGGTTWLLRALPATFGARRAQADAARALAELIDGLIEREYGDGPLDDQARWAVACHSAVRAGDALRPEEMAALIEQLERCDMRRTCPHGRPTMIHLSHAQLEREFGRR